MQYNRNCVESAIKINRPANFYKMDGFVLA